MTTDTNAPAQSGLFKRLLGEPLVHFIVLGAAIFGAWALVAGDGDRHRPGAIRIDSGTVTSLVSGFTRTWQRPPSQAELQDLLREHVRQEAAAREAIALGLDRDDTVIRRRLQQKLEFVSEELAVQAEPTEEELQAWLVAHRDEHLPEARIAFTQVFLSEARRGERAGPDAAAILARLRASPHDSVLELGDPILVELPQEAVPRGEIAARLGEPFAAALDALPFGSWEGPVQSAYGMHVVRVTERSEPTAPSLDLVREDVRRDLLAARRSEAREAFYARLLERHEVIWPEAGGGTGP